MIASQDVDEIARSMVYDGRIWCGGLPPEFGDTSLRARLDGAAFSLLVMVDGDSGVGPVSVRPQDRAHVELGGGALHEQFGQDDQDDVPADESTLLAAVRDLVDRNAADDGEPVADVMGRFLGQVADLFASGYRLALVDVGEDGGVGDIGDDVAQELPAAVARVWDSGWGRP